MIKILNFFVSIVVILSSVIRVDLGYGLNPTKKTVDLSDYKLVWSDEFSGNEIDRNKWNDSQNVSTVHWGAIRRGGYWHKDMISVHDAALHIETKYVNEEKARIMKVLETVQENHSIKDMQIEEISTEDVIKKIYEGGTEIEKSV